MDIREHKEKFDEIIKKYNFSQGEKAQEIAKMLTSTEITITALDFANKYSMDIEDAKIFLSFIEKGIKFRESIRKN